MSEDYRFDEALRYNQQCWQEHFKEDPELAKLDMAIARGERVMATTFYGSQIYAEARKQFDWYRNQRRELLRRRHEQPSEPEQPHASIGYRCLR
jgi:hypothetical protein